MIRWLVAILAHVALLASPLAANAMPEDDAAKPRVRAVIVGNTNYDPSATEVIRWVPLIGAYNDAVMVAETLLKEGVARDDITLITEKPKDDKGLTIHQTDLVPDGIGTRAAILGALKKVVDTTRPGDEVLISFSGHGYHQKEMVEGNEPDGADEIFIPLDIGDPLPGDPDKRLPRAITDDEIGAVIDAIRAKGGNVTYLADFCHSGDTMRNAGEPSDMPPAGILFKKKFVEIGNGDFVKDLAVETSKGKPGWGTFVAMMAAPSDTEAKQRNAPAFRPREDRAPHGILTAYSFANLGNPAVVTYRDLATRVGSNISEYEKKAPLPLFDGDLDRPILGGLLKSAGEARDSWLVVKPSRPRDSETMEVDSLEMSAGSFNGVTPGTIIALSSVRQNGEEQVLLYGKVESTTAFTAKLVPASFDDIDASAWQDIRDIDGDRFSREAKLIATIAQRAIDVSFRVARPRLPASPTEAQKAVLRWIDGLTELELGKMGVTFVEPGDEADLLLNFDGRMLAVSEAGTKVTDYGAADIEALYAEDGQAEIGFVLGPSLTRAARFARLRKVLASDDAMGTQADNPSQKVAVRFYLLRSEDNFNADGSCRIPPSAGLAYEKVSPMSRPLGDSGFTDDGGRVFRKCDLLSIEIENTSGEEVYINPVFFTSSGAIYWLPSLRSSSDVRYPPGRKGVAHLQFGKEMDAQRLQDELIVLVSEQGDGTAVSYAKLVQQPVLVASSEAEGKLVAGETPTMTLRSGGASAGGLDAVLNSVLGGADRSGTSGQATATGAVRFEFTVPPADRAGS
ncbi:caspase family protein [Pseudoblastomonas halimionae]|uniref:Peptidase C14 caspase domain-containing protein n=1 Tax=Alteriqipengyuania halimionae TaxID=1926630 RepID=A0A6I4U4P4_9SPHN|nr:caspase family protein [Alteriqipengyuania halimionae]MXP09895.1 hypothetical protein [Alteriqipengyuania halimionae]